MRIPPMFVRCLDKVALCLPAHEVRTNSASNHICQRKPAQRTRAQTITLRAPYTLPRQLSPLGQPGLNDRAS
jgi:hypothetical protein